MALSFEAPNGIAFPQDQPTVTSYVLHRTVEKTDVKANAQPVDDSKNGLFTIEDIKKAFTLFDLDKNGYIGAAELRHSLIFMGEHVTDEEVDMMISMLDMNGDGQVSFNEFKTMVEADDPSKEDFLSEEYNKKALELPSLSAEAQQKRNNFQEERSICKMHRNMQHGYCRCHENVGSLTEESVFFSEQCQQFEFLS
eukprot:CCRYP_012374-RA/>CCRYP_012374-RA protein AED:0.62 eAED:0.14 QI:0/0/0/1/1/0.5/2/0/195